MKIEVNYQGSPNPILDEKIRQAIEKELDAKQFSRGFRASVNEPYLWFDYQEKKRIKNQWLELGKNTNHIMNILYELAMRCIIVNFVALRYEMVKNIMMVGMAEECIKLVGIKKSGKIMKIPKRVRDCVAHHEACDCHQWRYEQLESALQVIYVWASFEVEKGIAVIEMEDIVQKAYEALHCLDEIKEKNVERR